MKDKKPKVRENIAQVTSKIRELTKLYPYYGYRKIYAVLKYKEGITVRRNTVYKIMREHHLTMPASYSKKKLFKGVSIATNVEASQSNTLWGIDMTYIWCGKDAWCYFHGVIDHHDKVLLGYHFSKSCSALGGVMALSEAATNRPVDNLELRSDNGCHYGAKIFRDEIKRLGIKHTRTMVNTPKGNAVIERFFKSLKQECVWQHGFTSYEEARDVINKWVKFYNSERPHQTLNYVTPEMFYQEAAIQKYA